MNAIALYASYIHSPEDPKETHAGTEKTCKLHIKRDQARNQTKS